MQLGAPRRLFERATQARCKDSELSQGFLPSRVPHLSQLRSGLECHLTEHGNNYCYSLHVMLSLFSASTLRLMVSVVSTLIHVDAQYVMISAVTSHDALAQVDAGRFRVQTVRQVMSQLTKDASLGERQFT